MVFDAIAVSRVSRAFRAASPVTRALCLWESVALSPALTRVLFAEVASFSARIALVSSSLIVTFNPFRRSPSTGNQP